MTSKHDKAVRRTANWYRDNGYDVQADIPGFKKPSTYYGHRPDVVAKKSRDKVFVEVETPTTVKSDIVQRRRLSAYARKHNARFRTKVTK